MTGMCVIPDMVDFDDLISNSEQTSNVSAILRSDGRSLSYRLISFFDIEAVGGSYPLVVKSWPHGLTNSHGLVYGDTMPSEQKFWGISGMENILSYVTEQENFQLYGIKAHKIRKYVPSITKDLLDGDVSAISQKDNIYKALRFWLGGRAGSFQFSINVIWLASAISAIQDVYSDPAYKGGNRYSNDRMANYNCDLHYAVCSCLDQQFHWHKMTVMYSETDTFISSEMNFSMFYSWRVTSIEGTVYRWSLAACKFAYIPVTNSLVISVTGFPSPVDNSFGDYTNVFANCFVIYLKREVITINGKVPLMIKSAGVFSNTKVQDVYMLHVIWYIGLKFNKLRAQAERSTWVTTDYQISITDSIGAVWRTAAGGHKGVNAVYAVSGGPVSVFYTSNVVEQIEVSQDVIHSPTVFYVTNPDFSSWLKSSSPVSINGESQLLSTSNLSQSYLIVED